MIQGDSPTISGAFSIFLDLLRFYAAICVVVFHASFGWFGEVYTVGFIHGHDAVIVFFVLSGFVISHSQNRNRRSFREFIIARLARLSATLIPAIVVTLLCTAFVVYHNQELAQSLLKPMELARYIVCLAYVQNIWFRNFTPGFNGPFWSLSYEFFYYFIFAAATLLATRRLRWIAATTISIVAGPSILLLMPAWIFGVVVHRTSASHIQVRYRLVVRTFGVVGILVSFGLLFTGWRYPDHPGTPPLNFASSFISDGFFAFSVAAWLGFARSILTFDASKKFIKAARRLGDLTFPIYVFHFPVLAVLAALGGAETVVVGPQNRLGLILALTSTTILSLLAEQLRPSLDRLIRIVLGRTAIHLSGIRR